MIVRVTLVGQLDHTRRLVWPDHWPIPREGESVDLPDLAGLAVRTVVWYPEGDDGEPEPFVYLVVGRHRP